MFWFFGCETRGISAPPTRHGNQHRMDWRQHLNHWTPREVLITIPDFSRSAQSNTQGDQIQTKWTRITSALWVRGPAGLISGESASFPGGQTRNPSEKGISSPRAVSPSWKCWLLSSESKEEGKERASGKQDKQWEKESEGSGHEPVLVWVPQEADCEAGLRGDGRKYRHKCRDSTKRRQTEKGTISSSLPLRD